MFVTHIMFYYMKITEYKDFVKRYVSVKKTYKTTLE